MTGQEPTAVDQLTALRKQHETLRAAYLRLEGELNGVRVALAETKAALDDEHRAFLVTARVGAKDAVALDTARAEVERLKAKLTALEDTNAENARIGAAAAAVVPVALDTLASLQSEVERLKAEHCKDCCCAQAWKALGIADYTGRSIPEEIERLKAEHRDDQDTIDRADEHTKMLMAEIERLTAALSASEAQTVQREWEAMTAAAAVIRAYDGPNWGVDPQRDTRWFHARAIEDERDRRYSLPAGEERCDHKFVDSTRCLKCGWEPPMPGAKP